MGLNLQDGLLVDIGGGSTELVLYEEGKIQNTMSLPIGSFSLHKKYADDFLPSKREMKRIEKRVLKELNKIEEINIPVNTKIICGVGGTVRATCKLKNDIYDLPLQVLE